MRWAKEAYCNNDIKVVFSCEVESMNADYVENIIRNIDKQSYKCILVDGAWGIGKSYMVRKALEDMKDRTCFISLLEWMTFKNIP